MRQPTCYCPQTGWHHRLHGPSRPYQRLHGQRTCALLPGLQALAAVQVRRMNKRQQEPCLWATGRQEAGHCLQRLPQSSCTGTLGCAWLRLTVCFLFIPWLAAQGLGMRGRAAARLLHRQLRLSDTTGETARLQQHCTCVFESSPVCTG